LSKFLLSRETMPLSRHSNMDSAHNAAESIKLEENPSRDLRFIEPTKKCLTFDLQV
jgi:hypothetical protein